MYYIYREFSYAGWIALGAFLLYWAIVELVRAIARRKRARRDLRGFDVVRLPAEPPIDQNVEHHEDQP